MGNVPFWYCSIDMSFILFPVKFEGVLFISVLRIEANLYKKLEFKTEEFLKV
jgi:hypothetical protein